MTFADDNFFLGTCMSCRLMECIQSCVDWMMNTRLMKALKRIFPLATASWMIADMVLDFNQTITYYYLIDGFSEGGEYHDWALQYKDEMNETRLQTISPGYFYTACAVWMIPPVLGSFFRLFIGDLIFPYLFKAIFKCNIGDIRGKKKSLMFYPLELITCILFVYVIIPPAALKNGVKHLLKGEVDEEEELIVTINSKNLPFVKLFEIIGEALPQYILTLVFACNNYPFLKDNDTYFGFPIPVSIISLVFSFGSLIMGVITGYKSYKKMF